MKRFQLALALVFLLPASAMAWDGPFTISSLEATKNSITMGLSDGRTFRLNCSTSTSQGLCWAAQCAFASRAAVFVDANKDKLEQLRLEPPIE